MYYSTEMEYSCVIVDNFQVVILELNYIGEKGLVIVPDYIAKVIVIMITIAVTIFLVRMSVSQVQLRCKQAFLFILYLMHAPRVYFNSG